MDIPVRNGKAITEWVDWLAWYPVRTWDGQRIWFKKIYRRKCRLWGYLSPYGEIKFWQYAARINDNIERETE